MRALRDALLRQAYRVAYRLLQVQTLIRRPRRRGVKCLLTHEGEVLLVRHTYGPRRIWHVPGGGVRRRESSLVAGRREMHEELGLRDLDLREMSSIELRLARRPVRLSCLHAELADRRIAPDRAEIATARWFAPEALPAPLGGEVRTLVAMWRESTH